MSVIIKKKKDDKIYIESNHILFRWFFGFGVAKNEMILESDTKINKNP